jgi:hypothetical protein
MTQVSFSIASFIESLPEGDRPGDIQGRLTQKILESHGLLERFKEWKRQQHRELSKQPRTETRRERCRVNQVVSRALRDGRAQTREQALALVTHRYTASPGPIPRRPRWYDKSNSNALNLRQTLLQKLHATSFPSETHRRQAIRQGTSLVFGTVFDRCTQRYRTSSQEQCNPCLVKLVRDLAAEEVPDFSYTTIVINKNVVTNPHKDKYNVGPTLLLGLGNFRGGDLVVSGQSFKISCHRWLYFWGKDEHYNTPLTYGSKYTITLFTLLPPYASPDAQTHSIIGQMT